MPETLRDAERAPGGADGIPRWRSRRRVFQNAGPWLEARRGSRDRACEGTRGPALAGSREPRASVDACSRDARACDARTEGCHRARFVRARSECPGGRANVDPCVGCYCIIDLGAMFISAERKDGSGGQLRVIRATKKGVTHGCGPHPVVVARQATATRDVARLARPVSSLPSPAARRPVSARHARAVRNPSLRAALSRARVACHRAGSSGRAGGRGGGGVGSRGSSASKPGFDAA